MLHSSLKRQSSGIKHTLPSAHRMTLLRARGSSRSVAGWTSWLKADQVLPWTFLVVSCWKVDFCTPPTPSKVSKCKRATPTGRVRGGAEKGPKMSGFDCTEHWALPPHPAPFPHTRPWICVCFAWSYPPLWWEDNPFSILILPLKTPVFWQRFRKSNKNINITKNNNSIFVKTLSFPVRYKLFKGRNNVHFCSCCKPSG